MNFFADMAIIFIYDEKQSSSLASGNGTERAGTRDNKKKDYTVREPRKGRLGAGRNAEIRLCDVF
jgi:hypothetical protein